MRIITDSAADFTCEELKQYQVSCVPMQVMFNQESFSADTLSAETFWQRLLSGEIAKTSQPSPDAFLAEYEAAEAAHEEIVYIGAESEFEKYLKTLVELNGNETTPSGKGEKRKDEEILSFPFGKK